MSHTGIVLIVIFTYQFIVTLKKNLKIWIVRKIRMTNEKLTNEEVIKILKEAIDVINRQETKIVILKDYTKDLIAEIRKLTGCEIISNFTENQRRIRREAKTEAYKEFAERIKLSIKANVVETLCNDARGVYKAEYVLDDIDNLLKEMVGEEE